MLIKYTYNRICIDIFYLLNRTVKMNLVSKYIQIRRKEEYKEYNKDNIKNIINIRINSDIIEIERQINFTKTPINYCKYNQSRTSASNLIKLNQYTSTAPIKKLTFINYKSTIVPKLKMIKMQWKNNKFNIDKFLKNLINCKIF